MILGNFKLGKYIFSIFHFLNFFFSKGLSGVVSVVDAFVNKVVIPATLLKLLATIVKKHSVLGVSSKYGDALSTTFSKKRCVHKTNLSAVCLIDPSKAKCIVQTALICN